MTSDTRRLPPLSTLAHGPLVVDNGGTDRYTLSTLHGFFPAGPEKSSEGHATPRHATPSRLFLKASNGAGHRGSRSRGEQCGRSELARQAARPQRRSVPPSTSRRQLLVGTDWRRKLTSSCGFELRLLPPRQIIRAPTKAELNSRPKGRYTPCNGPDVLGINPFLAENPGSIGVGPTVHGTHSGRCA